ncbi:MAG TPA: HipA family kinase [Candidatus Eisenbacteria bacterium]|nr:HipA family kinase [Candidatus Eisenbacteria bacterium]
MVRALEQIRRMRGGAQSHLMRCSDGCFYVVKFQNNPQHPRVLVNELLGTRLASRLGLTTAPVEVVEVDAELIRLTPELCIELPRSRTACAAGLQFGSRYPGDPRELTLHDFLPDEKLREVENLHEFAGMLVFDKWTCNTNGRQTIFFEQASRTGPATGKRDRIPTGDAMPGAAERGPAYRTEMIDQGFCFNAGEWNFPDAPLRGLYARNRVYEGVIGMESFGPWLERLERNITEKALAQIVEEIPPAWYADEYDAVLRLVEQLQRRKRRVEELILSAKNSNRAPFANWR